MIRRDHESRPKAKEPCPILFRIPDVIRGGFEDSLMTGKEFEVVALLHKCCYYRVAGRAQPGSESAIPPRRAGPEALAHE